MCPTVNDDRMAAIGIPSLVKILNAIDTVQSAVGQISTFGCRGACNELTEMKQMLRRVTEKLDNGQKVPLPLWKLKYKPSSSTPPSVPEVHQL